MQIALLLAVVTAVTISESAPHYPVAWAPARLAIALGAMAVVVGFAAASAIAVATSLEPDRNSLATPLKWFERLKRVHTLLWLAVTAAVFYLLDWPQLVRYNWGLNRVILVRDVLVMLPVWLPWVLSWAAFYEVEQSVRRALDPTATESGPRHGRMRFVWLQTRHWLALVLLPILLLLTAKQCATIISPSWFSATDPWWFYIAALGTVLFFFPVLLARLWDTSPMADPSLVRKLRAASAGMGVRCRGFRVWHTDYRVLNAAVAGFQSSLRYVFFTDALLKHLDSEALEAILIHECGHIRRHHLPLRMALLGLPAWALLWVQVFASPATDSMLSNCLGAANTLSLLIPLLVTVYAVVALGWYSRLLEFDADLCVLHAGKSLVLVGALQSLSHLSNEDPKRRTWLHPSLQQRVCRLVQAERNPDSATRFRRRVNRLNVGIVAAWVLIPASIGTLALVAG